MSRLTLHRALWTLLTALLAPVWLAALCAVPRLRLPLRERLGGLPDALPSLSEAGPRVLFHAASGGDVRAVVPVARALHALRPDARLVCTVQTRSAVDMARRLDAPFVVTALPLEAAPCVDRFVAALRPDLLVLEYLELWPRLVSCVRRRGGRVALINGRIHPARMPRYQRPGARLLRDLLADLALCTARSEDDAARLAALGAPAPSVHPHTKHALLEQPSPTALARLLEGRALEPLQRHMTWVAGSVHADELDLVLDAQVRLGSATRLVLCPRYPELGASAARRAEQRQLNVCRVGPRAVLGPPDATVVVVETTGELARWYGHGAVALVGGTLGRRGGQNPLEPAIAGCSLVVGPSTVQIDAELAWLGAAHVRTVPPDAAALASAVAAGLEQAARDDRSAMQAAQRVRAEAEVFARALAERLAELLPTGARDTGTDRPDQRATLA